MRSDSCPVIDPDLVMIKSKTIVSEMLQSARSLFFGIQCVVIIEISDPYYFCNRL